MVARRAHNPKVVGSSPSSATKKTPCPIRDKEFFLVLQKRFCICDLRVMSPWANNLLRRRALAVREQARRLADAAVEIFYKRTRNKKISGTARGRSKVSRSRLPPRSVLLCSAQRCPPDTRTLPPQPKFSLSHSGRGVFSCYIYHLFFYENMI